MSTVTTATDMCGARDPKTGRICTLLLSTGYHADHDHEAVNDNGSVTTWPKR